MSQLPQWSQVHLIVRERRFVGSDLWVVCVCLHFICSIGILNVVLPIYFEARNYNVSFRLANSHAMDALRRWAQKRTGKALVLKKHSSKPSRISPVIRQQRSTKKLSSRAILMSCSLRVFVLCDKAWEEKAAELDADHLDKWREEVAASLTASAWGGSSSPLDQVRVGNTPRSSPKLL